MMALPKVTPEEIEEMRQDLISAWADTPVFGDYCTGCAPRVLAEVRATEDLPLPIYRKPITVQEAAAVRAKWDR